MLRPVRLVLIATMIATKASASFSPYSQGGRLHASLPVGHSSEDGATSVPFTLKGATLGAQVATELSERALDAHLAMLESAGFNLLRLTFNHELSQVATDTRYMTNGTYPRVDHVASDSNSPCVSLLSRGSAAPLISSTRAGPIPP